jgi:uncharacterized protein YecE (DUF72 family)
MAADKRVRVGIGGWDYAPWRETFYPADVPQKRALEYASRQVSSIEINGTFYRTAKPENFASWNAQTPDDFVFSVKATRYATNRKVLGEAGESIERFINSGLTELGDKLGALLWQLAGTKRFDPDDLEAFFKLLPPKLGHRFGRLPFLRRRDRRLRVRAPDEREQRDRDRLHQAGLEKMGGARRTMAQRRLAGGPALRGYRGQGRQTARRVRLLHQRRQGTRAGSSPPADSHAG